MWLSKLIDAATWPGAKLVPTGDVEITGITEFHDRVQPGWLFAARQGRTRDGRDFIDEAIARGAAAVLTDEPAELRVPQVSLIKESTIVTAKGYDFFVDISTAIGHLCQAFHGHPSRSMIVVGVTGTNGKTTTCWMTRQLLEAIGQTTGLVSTVAVDDGSRSTQSRYTTPPAEELAASLAAMRDNGCTAAVLELSAHGLHQDRAAGVELAAAGWTTLSQDHLDHFDSMYEYVDAKLDILKMMDDECSIVIFEDTFAKVVDVYGDFYGDFYSDQAESWLGDGCRWTQTPGDRSPWHVLQPIDPAATIDLPSGIAVPPGSLATLPPHDRRNALMALELVAGAIKATPEQVATLINELPRLTRPPGRMEEVPCPGGGRVLVDYAHTPHALESVIAAARSVTPGHLIVVTGAGGNRDKFKRPEMGAALRQADYVILTSDNPRSENPEQIADSIASFMDQTERIYIEDRREAIRLAAEWAVSDPAATVIIAGKGHEQTQEFADRTVPFCDREVATECIAELTGS